MGNHDDEPPAMNSNVVKGKAEQRRGKSNSNSDAPLGNLRVPIKTMLEINFYSFSRHFHGSDGTNAPTFFSCSCSYSSFFIKFSVQDEYGKQKKRLL
ncbi:hypothetical protein GBA52_012246 [Prunus armeniaca]|nr:hypothetical protein GBA52_012246 [Prunus armeniaca]